MTPAKFEVRCEVNCSLDEEIIGPAASAALLALRERGFVGRPFAREAGKILGRVVTEASARRHVRHYKELIPEPEQEAPKGRVTDLEILQGIIEAGFRNSKNWKPSIKDTLDAMKLKTQLTGASAFEDMLAMLDSALDLADEEDQEPPVEAPEAQGLPDELPEPDLGED